jgi:hypothetical protein
MLSTDLVLLRSSLASLELIQIPTTDIHIALVLGHAISVTLDVHRAGPGSLAVVGSRRIVERRIHGAAGLCVAVGGLLVLLLLGGCGGGAAAEETTNRMAD